MLIKFFVSLPSEWRSKFQNRLQCCSRSPPLHLWHDPHHAPRQRENHRHSKTCRSTCYWQLSGQSLLFRILYPYLDAARCISIRSHLSSAKSPLSSYRGGLHWTLQFHYRSDLSTSEPSMYRREIRARIEAHECGKLRVWGKD